MIIFTTSKLIALMPYPSLLEQNVKIKSSSDSINLEVCIYELRSKSHSLRSFWQKTHADQGNPQKCPKNVKINWKKQINYMSLFWKKKKSERGKGKREKNNDVFSSGLTRIVVWIFYKKIYM